MRTIWKYELRPVDVQVIDMPQGATILTVASQQVQESGPGWARAGVVPMLWAWVDPDAPTEARRIAIVGTGNPAPAKDEATYLGSAMCPPFVWHVFEQAANAASPDGAA